jgi:hypothetical protein
LTVKPHPVIAAKDIHAVTFWEIVFIVIATGFTLAEYTASQEHGWISKPDLSSYQVNKEISFPYLSDHLGL